MFTTRDHTGSGRKHLDLKVLLFGVGLLLLLVGIRLRHDWLVWSAILPLGCAFALRFLARRDRDEHAADPGRTDVD